MPYPFTWVKHNTWSCWPLSVSFLRQSHIHSTEENTLHVIIGHQMQSVSDDHLDLQQVTSLSKHNFKMISAKIITWEWLPNLSGGDHLCQTGFPYRVKMHSSEGRNIHFRYVENSDFKERQSLQTYYSLVVLIIAHYMLLARSGVRCSLAMQPRLSYKLLLRVSPAATLPRMLYTVNSD